MAAVFLRRARSALNCPNAVHALLNTIDERLSAIERHLGMAGDGGSADAGSEGAGSDRLQAEVSRLRALLREHDIDPGDPGDASAAAG